MYLNYRKDQRARVAAEAAVLREKLAADDAALQAKLTSDAISIQSVAVMMKEDRDRLQGRLDMLAATSERQIADLKAASERALAEAETKWGEQHKQDQVRITALQAEVTDLYRQLNTRPPTPVPTSL